jgi:hypothetical protein
MTDRQRSNLKEMTMQAATRIEFSSFNKTQVGRVITHSCGVILAYARNPYGSHNPVVLWERADGRFEALHHGAESALLWAKVYMGQRAYRRLRKFLAQRGKAVEWVIN